MRRRATGFVLAVAVAVGASVKAFRSQLPKIRRTTTVPILLPRTLPVLGRARKVYATGGATHSYPANSTCSSTG